MGKSTVAKALANRFGRAIHLDIDSFRLMVVKGIALPMPGNWNEETARQFDLAHIAAGQTANVYASAGFAVIAEHASHTPYIQSFLAHSGSAIVVSLTADLSTNQARNSARTSDSFDYEGLGFVIQMLNETMPEEHRTAGFPVLDTTNNSVEETVDQILKLSDER